MAQIFFHNDCIVEVLENGVHAGSRVVDGTSWDVSESKGEVIDLVRDGASLSALGSVSYYFTVDKSRLPIPAQEGLDLSNRASVTASEMLSSVVWATDMHSNYVYERESEN